MKATARGFSRQPLGQHLLETFIPGLLAEAGLCGYYTLHSLRATCATRLYRQGFDEQVIMEVTGHSSLAVREYKRTSEEMRKDASLTLQGAGGGSHSASLSMVNSSVEMSGGDFKASHSSVASEFQMLGESSNADVTVGKKLRLECGDLKFELHF